MLLQLYVASLFISDLSRSDFGYFRAVSAVPGAAGPAYLRSVSGGHLPVGLWAVGTGFACVLYVTRRARDPTCYLAVLQSSEVCISCRCWGAPNRAFNQIATAVAPL